MQKLVLSCFVALAKPQQNPNAENESPDFAASYTEDSILTMLPWSYTTSPRVSLSHPIYGSRSSMGSPFLNLLEGPPPREASPNSLQLTVSLSTSLLVLVHQSMPPTTTCSLDWLAGVLRQALARAQDPSSSPSVIWTSCSRITPSDPVVHLQAQGVEVTTHYTLRKSQAKPKAHALMLHALNTRNRSQSSKRSWLCNRGLRRRQNEASAI